MSSTIIRSLAGVFLAATLILGAGCSSAPAAAKAMVDECAFISVEGMEESIDKLMEKDPTLGAISSPYAFIKDGCNEYYNSIVALGEKAIPRLVAVIEESPTEGCADYLLAVALEEVSGADLHQPVDGHPAATAKEFLKVWNSLQK